MMKLVKIQAYTFDELDAKGKANVIYWLDECPLDYEDENGIMQYQYFSDADESDISDHCEINGYIFNQYGKPIHQLIVE